jgi:hypothetical protein
MPLFDLGKSSENVYRRLSDLGQRTGTSPTMINQSYRRESLDNLRNIAAGQMPYVQDEEARASQRRRRWNKLRRQNIVAAAELDLAREQYDRDMALELMKLGQERELALLDQPQFDFGKTEEAHRMRYAPKWAETQEGAMALAELEHPTDWTKTEEGARHLGELGLAKTIAGRPQEDFAKTEEGYRLGLRSKEGIAGLKESTEYDTFKTKDLHSRAHDYARNRAMVTLTEGMEPQLDSDLYDQYYREFIENRGQFPESPNITSDLSSELADLARQAGIGTETKPTPKNVPAIVPEEPIISPVSGLPSKEQERMTGLETSRIWDPIYPYLRQLAYSGSDVAPR